VGCHISSVGKKSFIFPGQDEQETFGKEVGSMIGSQLEVFPLFRHPYLGFFHLVQTMSEGSKSRRYRV